LGVVRLALDCDYDRLELMAHYDKLTRQIMGLDENFSGEFGKGFHHKTISDNVCHVDEDLLKKINEIVVKEGQKLFKKKDQEKLNIKSDTYVLESNVHFPTDLNLLWDASRKSIELLAKLFERVEHPGWRKAKDWKQQLKSMCRTCSKIQHGGGANKEKRLQKAVKIYLSKAYELEKKIFLDVQFLESLPLTTLQAARLIDIDYYHSMLIKHLDLIERRLLTGEKIPHEEKIFSLFEPHTEWIAKGKLHAPVELGRKLLISTDQFGLILDYKVMKQSSDVCETLPLVDRLINRFGEDQIQSLSVDKGFSNEADRELLEQFIPEVIMLKKGTRSQTDQIRESQKSFRRRKWKHSAIEANIFCLEKHGLNRCPDKGNHGFTRYVGFGVLAYNLHRIGNRLIATQLALKKVA